MTTVQELKELKIEYPAESEIKGYMSFYNRVVKRVIDFILALFLIIVLSPVLIVVSIMIVIDDGRPVFYRAQRGGYKNKSFYIFKFRSMVNNADKIGGGTTALNDRRITKVGNILRKTKLDEFANLFNIIRGEMSFIGERDIIVTTKKNIVFSRVVAANSVSL